MVDHQMPSAATDSATNKTVTGPVADSGDEAVFPAEMAEPRQDNTPLVERIRRDRQDLEEKIKRLKAYISTSSEVMKKLKGQKEMKEKYDNIAATRTELVRNAVNLQTLLLKLRDSESRAGLLAGRERALAAEAASRVQPPASQSTPELSQELETPLSAEALEQLDPEDRANYEKKQNLLKQIHEQHEKLRTMEAQQNRLRSMKDDVERRLAEARANRQGIEEKANALLQEVPLAVPEASGGAQRSALEELNARVAALQSLPLDSLDRTAAEQLQARLDGLAQKRRQVEEMVGQLEQLQQCRQERLSQLTDEDEPACSQPPAAADLSEQRQRLQQLQLMVDSIKQTMSAADTTALDVQQAQLQKQQLAEQQLQLQEQTLQRKAEQVEETRRRLREMRQLMSEVEAARERGERLSESVPQQLSQLLAGVEAVDSGQQADQPAEQPQQDHSQRRAEEYVDVLKRLQDSVDQLTEMKFKE